MSHEQHHHGSPEPSDDGTHQAALISGDDGSLEIGGDHLLSFLDPIQLPLFAAQDVDHGLPTVVPVEPIDPPISFPDTFFHDTAHWLFT
jgi:hypothetical protein